MADKYMDLYETIADDMLIRPDEVSVSRCVLEWLDEHPDQVPGRTITASEFDEAVESCVTEDATVPTHTFAARLGVVCVPDPEPTNAEKLEALLEGGDINAQWGLRGGGVMFARELAHALDEAGVKAPGGDDESDADV